MIIRGTDNYGSGRYHASRGNRLHNGIDIVCDAGTPVKSLGEGHVTKIGYPYSDNLNYRYVQITDTAGARWRYFYVCPLLAVGDSVGFDTVIGVCQNIAARYPRITPHYHLEIINAAGDFIDPTGFVEDV